MAKKNLIELKGDGSDSGQKKNNTVPVVDTSYAANTGAGGLDNMMAPIVNMGIVQPDTTYAANTGGVPTVSAPSGIQQQGGHEVSSSGQRTEGFNKPSQNTISAEPAGMPGVEQIGGHQVVDASGEIIGTTPLNKTVDTSYAANTGTGVQTVPPAQTPVQTTPAQETKPITQQPTITESDGSAQEAANDYVNNPSGWGDPALSAPPSAPSGGGVDTSYGANIGTPSTDVPSKTPSGGSVGTQGGAPSVDTSYGANTGNRENTGGNAVDKNGNLKLESAFANVTPIDSYDEYMRKRTSALKDTHDATVGYYDEQESKSLGVIEEQRQAGETYAKEQKDISDKALADQTDAANKFAEEQRAAEIGVNADVFGMLVESLKNQKGISEAELLKQKQLLDTLTEEQKSAVYAYAEKAKNDELSYIAQRYDTLVAALNKYKETGTALADDKLQLLLGMSEEMRAKVYEAAELQRQGAYESADIERERSVVDARSSYEQNKASYGANAEAIAGMGLAASGFSDRHDMAAYAQQRAETQNANARAATIKREADAAERQAKLGADTEYIQNTTAAKADHLQTVGDIDLSYQKNMLDAELERGDGERSANRAYDSAIYEADEAERQNKYISESEFSKGKSEIDLTYEKNIGDLNAQKAESDFNAYSKERETKYNTEQARIAEQAGIDLTYGKNMFDTNTQARADRLTTEQAADAGRFDAELSYRNNMLTNDDTIAAYRQQKADELEAKLEAEDAQNKEMYLKLFDLAASGSYSAEDIASIAGAMGLSDARSSGGGSVLSSIYDMANKAQQTIAETENKENTANNAMLRSMLSGLETPEELKTIAEANGMSVEEVNKVAGDSVPEKVKTYLQSDDIDSATAAANAAKEGGLIDDAKYKACCFDIGVKKAQSATDSDSLALIESDLTKMKNSGQLTDADYNQLVTYMYQNYGGVLDKGKYTASISYAPFVNGIKVTINGIEYKMSIGLYANKEKSRILSKLVNNTTEEGTLAAIGEEIFILHNGKWVTVGGEITNKGFAEKYFKLESEQADVAVPRHTA